MKNLKSLALQFGDPPSPCKATVHPHPSWHVSSGCPQGLGDARPPSECWRHPPHPRWDRPTMCQDCQGTPSLLKGQAATPSQRCQETEVAKAWQRIWPQPLSGAGGSAPGAPVVVAQAKAPRSASILSSRGEPTSSNLGRGSSARTPQSCPGCRCSTPACQETPLQPGWRCTSLPRKGRRTRSFDSPRL